MLKIFSILLALVTCATGFTRNTADRYKLSFPSYIPAYSSFDVSLITSNTFQKADRLELFLIPDTKVTLNKIDLHSLFNKQTLSFSPAQLNGTENQAYKAVINLSDTLIAPGAFFQIIFNFTSEAASYSDFKLMGVYKIGNRVLGRISAGDGSENSADFITARFNFYKPPKNAGSAILFTKDSQFKISLGNIDAGRILVDFWLKLNTSEQKIVEIANKNRSDTFYSISTNVYQMLMIEKNGKIIDNLNSAFLSRRNWYHISVDFSFTSNSLKFYCDGNWLGSIQLPDFAKPGDYSVRFGSLNTDNNFQLDLLRFVNLGNTIDVSFSNKNYLNFIADSSTLIYQFNFDNTEQLNIKNDWLVLSQSNVQFVHSDAPIFTRAPELNISILTNSNNLRWNGGDYKQAKYYVLQKSSDNSGYRDVYQVSADNNSGTVYTFEDITNESSGIVYYRVKQVNSDGSSVFSSQVKVGQGSQAPFLIRQNYPNPFNPKTNILIELLTASQVDLTVYNLEGKIIAKLYNGFLSQGIHTFTFDGTDLPSGVYLYKITTPGYSETNKMILTK